MEFSDWTSKTYKIIVNDKNYLSWEIYDSDTLIEIKREENIELYKKINPVEQKLFSSDIFNFENGELNIIHSITRQMPHLSAVLHLKNNKTYGKIKDKFIYKCVPDDKRLPSFLVPYKNKTGFSKNILNKYVIIKYKNWDNKHPEGIIHETIGDVDKLSNFYEYQLYCKSLYSSIQNFNKDVSSKLKQKTENEFIFNMIEKYNLVDRTSEKVFTIDSETTSDYDDALSIQEIPNTNTNRTKISIYIANVPLWMEELNLWNSFSDRIATIYLPDRKRPMLPLPLSNCVCSLCEGVTRLAFGIDLIIENSKIIDFKLVNCFIKVYKNHVYESKELKKDKNYNKMFKCLNEISKNYSYISTIKYSTDFVSYLMIIMNYYTSREMVKFNTGIFRSVNFNKNFKKKDDLPLEVNNFLKFWNSSSGQYDLYDSLKCHEMLELESYIHCTSPIRRLVDLLNMAKLQEKMKLIHFKNDFEKFYQKWTNKLDFINTSMRAIRKIQNDCSLLDLCTNNPEICKTIFDGYIFDKIIRNDGLYQFMVYIHKINIVSRITLRKDLVEFCKYNFKVFMFQDEDSFKKKVRLYLVENE